MLKKLVVGMVLLTGVAFADPTLRLEQDQVLEGTYQGTHVGQILMRSSEGKDLVIPAMDLFWYSEVPVVQSQLTVGQNLKMILPRNLTMRVIQPQLEPMVLGNYEGVHKIASSTVTGWKTMDVEAASR